MYGNTVMVILNTTKNKMELKVAVFGLEAQISRLQFSVKID